MILLFLIVLGIIPIIYFTRDTVQDEIEVEPEIIVEEEKPKTIKAIEKPKKAKTNKPKKSVNKSKKKSEKNEVKENKPKRQRIKYDIPYDLEHDACFVSYVRWMYYYEQLLHEDTPEKDLDRLKDRYFFHKSRIIARFVDREDNYFCEIYNNDLEKMFIECNKFHNYLKLLKGNKEYWEECLKQNEEAELQVLTTGEYYENPDEILNVGKADEVYFSMQDNFKKNIEESRDTTLKHNLIELGLSQKQANNAIEMVKNGASVEEALNNIRTDNEISEIFNENVTLDSNLDEVDVDGFLQELGLE